MVNFALNDECVCGEKLGQVTITVECRHRYHMNCARRMMRDTCAYCRSPSKTLKKIKKYQMLCTWRYLLEDLPEPYMQYVDGIKLPQVEEMAGWLVGEPDTKQIYEYLESLDEENSDDKHPFVNISNNWFRDPNQSLPFVTFRLSTTYRFNNNVFREITSTHAMPPGSIYIELANSSYHDLQIMPRRTETQVTNPIRVIMPTVIFPARLIRRRSRNRSIPRFPLYRSPRMIIPPLINAQYIRDVINRIRRRPQRLLE